MPPYDTGHEHHVHEDGQRSDESGRHLDHHQAPLAGGKWFWKAVGLLALGGVLAVASRCLVIVDETEFVIVNSFGRTAVLYGDQSGEAGPHARWPWQTKWSIDKRIRAFEPPAREVITADKQNLDVAGYILWRVVDPVRFIRGAGTAEGAEERLGERLAAGLGEAVGQRSLQSLISTDRSSRGLQEMTTSLRESMAAGALEELGVEIVDLGLRRFVPPVEVRPAVFELIRSERRQVAARIRAEAEAKYQEITSRADREAREEVARAEAEATRIEGEAVAERSRLLNEAHRVDPAFAAFLLEMDAYKSLLDQKSTVVLSTASPLFRLFSEGPTRGEPTWKEDQLPERGESEKP